MIHRQIWKTDKLVTQMKKRGKENGEVKSHESKNTRVREKFQKKTCETNLLSKEMMRKKTEKQYRT